MDQKMIDRMIAALLMTILLGCHLELAHANEESSDKNTKKPNIVFLLADDVNRDTWGVYGSVDCKTPNIDQLANEGMRFDRAYAAVAMCGPFRQELYSGRSPWRTKTLANHSKSEPNTKSLPHYLKPLGYRVILMGKSHVGPKKCYPFEYIPHGDKKKDHNPYYLKKTEEIFSKSNKTDEPFCLFIASNDGHGPYTTGDSSAYQTDQLTVPPYWVDTPQLRRVLRNYYAEITNFDRLVGKVRAQLEAHGLWENTIFMVSSEQGASLPFAKWTCYGNGLGSGLVAHWKGKTVPGDVCRELVSIADVAPTLVEAAGGTVKTDQFDGKSFISALRGKPLARHQYLIGAFTNCNILGNQKRIFPIRSIRTKSHTLIYNANFENKTSNITLDNALAVLENRGEADNSVATSWVTYSEKNSSAKALVTKLHERPEYELFSLKDDPHELSNVIEDPANRKTVSRLKSALMNELSELGDSDPIKTEKGLVRVGHSK